MRDKTYSKKAYRRVAALITRMSRGAPIEQSLTDFLLVIKQKAGYTDEEARANYDRWKAETYQKLLTDDAFRRKHDNMFVIVAKELGKKAYQPGAEMPPPGRPPATKTLSEGQREQGVAELLETMRKTTDQDEKRKLRRRLRRLGHTGGMRGGLEKVLKAKAKKGGKKK